MKIYKNEVKEFIQQQAKLGLTTKELREKCNARFPEYDFTDQNIRDFIRNNHIEHVKPEKEIRTLSPEERDFAEDNMNIVYDYLHKKRLEVSEWFDIVIFGYLDAVMKYHRKKELRQYAFTTIAWYAMNTEVGNRRCRKNAVKRTCEITSLDAVRAENDAGLNDILPDPSAEKKYHNVEFMSDMERLSKRMDRIQQKQLYLLYCGYKNREIERMLSISEHR